MKTKLEKTQCDCSEREITYTYKGTVRPENIIHISTQCAKCGKHFDKLRPEDKIKLKESKNATSD